jgi:Alpha-kinase family
MAADPMDIKPRSEHPGDRRVPSPQFLTVGCGASPPRKLTPKLVRRLMHVARSQRKCQFAGFDDDAMPTEKAVMHLYDAEADAWTEEVALVKMEPMKFAEGALRECFRAKMVRGAELVTLGKARCWEQATRWVAKRYKPEKTPDVQRTAYEEDVQLQMISKHYGELFDRHKPPKKVDFLQAFLLECVGREECTLYCVGRYWLGGGR